MDRVFWPLLGLGIIILILASTNYIEMLFGLTFTLLVIIWFKVNENNMSNSVFKEKLTEYLTKLETVVNKNGETDHIIEETAEGAETVTKQQLNDSLDRLAKKLIDVENKLGQFKKTLAAAFASLDERVKSLEEESFHRYNENE